MRVTTVDRGRGGSDDRRAPDASRKESGVADETIAVDDAVQSNLLAAAHAAFERGSVDEALRLAERVLHRVQGEDLRMEARALAFMAHCDRVGTPRLRRASEASRRAAQL